MANLNIKIPDDYLEELNEIAALLKMNLEECVQLALNYFMQFESIDNATVAMQRYTDKTKKTVAMPSLEEEFNLNIKFHPEALEEFQEFEAEDQAELILELADRISNAEEGVQDGVDLVLRETDEAQLVLSCFEFGDIVYEIGDHLTIYLISSPELEEDYEDEDEEEDDQEQDEEDEDFELYLEEDENESEENPSTNPFVN
ncbi:MAG TPA: hypothetical protein VJ205_03190 [Gammaproteobacteria bacterium]|nr:hypothetical protein [Gammaproteobacteria bacterium]